MACPTDNPVETNISTRYSVLETLWVYLKQIFNLMQAFVVLGMLAGPVVMSPSSSRWSALEMIFV